MSDGSPLAGGPPNYGHNNSKQRAGQAVVRLRDGCSYEGWTEVDAGLITVEGMRRTSTGPWNSRSIYGPSVVRSFPARALKRIDWR